MRVLITGAGGMLGQALEHALKKARWEVHAPGRSSLDITDTTAVHDTVRSIVPNVVINCAAYTRVDDAEDDEEAALRVNGFAATQLARFCKEVGARYVYPSTDYVFDGKADRPYPPDAPTNPLGAYGRSKLAGEKGAREAEDFLIVRTGWLYGPGGRNFVRTIAEKLKAGVPLRVVVDQRGAPTWTVDLARIFTDLLKHNAPSGTYHATNTGNTTWYDLAVAIAAGLGVRAEIEPCTSRQHGARAPRPAYSVLDCAATEKLVGPLRSWQSALGEALQTGAY